MSLRLASFFSGIGGIDLGFQQAGFDIAFQCEIDRFCLSILDKHWGAGIKRHADIKKVELSDIPVCDVWAGGFPCQDVSVARMGPRAGLKGKKSGLFYEFARLVEQGRPRVLLIENVPGLLSSHGGRDFQIILRSLADIGYGLGWRVLNSRYFGVAQSRQRVYLVGCYRDRRGAAEILFEPERSQRHHSEGRSNGEKSLSPFKTRIGDTSKGPLTPALAYCLYACSARHTGTDWSRNYASYPDGRVRRLMPIEAERLQGFPEGWTVPPDDCGDPDKVDTLRYNALGNAVTMPVAKWIARRISAYIGTQSTHTDADDPVALVG
jgi:DNA (cytosine-5)-methyltransferase 1